MSLNDRLSRHLDQGVVGFPTALASAVGLIMASPVILTATTGFGIGGGAFAMAMVIALVMMLRNRPPSPKRPACCPPTVRSMTIWPVAWGVFSPSPGPCPPT